MVVRQLISLPSQLQLLERLQHNIYLSSSLVFVSGEQGAGKSTLLEQLSNKLPGDVQEAFIQLNEQLSDVQIRQQIIAQLYDEPLFNAQDSLLSSISLLQHKQSSDVPRLIIFDNAHYLSTELLAELAALIAQKESLGENEINVLLLVEEERCQHMFAAAKQSPANCLEFKLEALSRVEASNLLNHIFSQAGYQHQVQHQDALSKQLAACAGIPEKIITLAERIIAGELIGSEPSWLKTRLPAIALMFFLLMVAAALVIYLYPLFIKSVPLVEVEEQLENPPLLNKADTLLSVSDNAIPEKVKPAMVEELAGNWKKELQSDIEENPLKVGINDAAVKHVFISEQNILALATPEQENVINLEQESKKRAKETSSEVRELQVSPVQNAPEVPTEGTQQADEIGEVKNLLKTENSAVDDKVVALAPEVALPIKSKKQIAEKEPDLIFTAKSQLLSVSPSRYTLQLSAMAAQKSLQEFTLQYGLADNNLHIYQTIRNNKPLYVVIFGEYDSREAAEKASKALPGPLANLDSWVKKYQLVHQDLQLNND